MTTEWPSDAAVFGLLIAGLLVGRIVMRRLA
jgi:hypothetical protein